MITRFAALLSFLGVCAVIGALFKAMQTPPDINQIRDLYFTWQIHIHAGGGVFLVTTVYLALINLFGQPPRLPDEDSAAPSVTPQVNQAQQAVVVPVEPVQKKEIPVPPLVKNESPLMRETPVESPVKAVADVPAKKTTRPEPEAGVPAAAYQILYLFQKEGRLLDFLMEDISGVDDDQLGGAIRPIHEGCRKILHERLKIEPVLQGPEGETVNVPEPHDPEEVKLTGNVPAKGPFSGTLVHRGWRLKECKLPELVSGWSGDVVAPAEVEIP